MITLSTILYTITIRSTLLFAFGIYASTIFIQSLDMSEENIVQGPPLQVEPILCSTGTFMYRCLLDNIEKGNYFVNEVTSKRIMYKDFLEYSCRLANSLTKYGITFNNIATICSENTIEYFIPIMSCLFAGIPIAPINPLYTKSEFTHAFSITKPEVVFCSAKCAHKILELRKEFPCIRLIIVINAFKKLANVWNLNEFIKQYSSSIDIYNYKPVEVNVEEHIAFIMFSSGTSGLPKGVMITHKNVNIKNATMLETFLNVEPERRSQFVLGFLPFFHAFGLHNIITATMHGCTVIVIEKFDLDLYLSCVQKYKISTLSGAPTIMQMYAKSPLIDKYDLSHVQRLLVGAGPVSKSLEEAVKKRLGIKEVGQGYGMTESTVALTLLPVGVVRPGSCGKLLPNLSAYVRDLSTGRHLGPNQDGELCFKGDVIMKGYYNNAEANNDVFTEDGYMKSGDIGHFDKDGFFYIVDRLKELIKYKGYQVPPAELEGILMNNSKIKEAAVVGLPDADAGELPLAFIVKQPDVSLTQEEVLEYVKKFVTPVKYLRGGVIFIDEIPRNPSGKILRRELRKKLLSLKSKL